MAGGEFELSGEHREIVRRLAQTPDVRTSDLRAGLEMSVFVFKRALSRLIDEELVDSYRSAGDRRQRQVRLTTAGVQLARELSHEGADSTAAAQGSR